MVPSAAKGRPAGIILPQPAALAPQTLSPKQQQMQRLARLAAEAVSSPAAPAEAAAAAAAATSSTAPERAKGIISAHSL